MSLREEFEAIVKHVQGLPKEGPYQPSNAQKLKFYGLFKQATEGPCKSSGPPIYKIVARAKWNAWHDLGNISQEESMRLYIEKYDEAVQSAKGLAPAS